MVPNIIPTITSDQVLMKFTQIHALMQPVLIKTLSHSPIHTLHIFEHHMQFTLFVLKGFVYGESFQKATMVSMQKHTLYTDIGALL